MARATAALERGGTDASPPPNPYGDGRAGERIADILRAELTGAKRRTEDWPGTDVAPGVTGAAG